MVTYFEAQKKAIAQIKRMSTKKIKDELSKRGHLNEWGRQQYKAELKRRGTPYKPKVRRAKPRKPWGIGW